MRTFTAGDGPPLVVIPGIHGRWEYLRRAVEALSASFRVIAFSLADEPGTDCPFDPARAMASYVEQVQRALDEQKVDRAAICGVSFGGLIALQFAASHAERVSALVLASVPGPNWTLNKNFQAYARHPLISAPLFFAGVPGRLRPELVRALPRARDRVRFRLEAARTYLRAPVSPRRMAARALAIDPAEIVRAAAAVRVRTLVIVGERALDRVVPTDGTSEYARVIQGATLARLEDTGHQGSLTRPAAFAAAISNFMNLPSGASAKEGHAAA